MTCKCALLNPYLFKCVRNSGNPKTGDIPQVYTTTLEELQGSCPTSCPLRKICYALTGMNTRRAWSEANLTLEGLKVKIAAIKKYLIRNNRPLLVRHNVAGDVALPGTDLINKDLLIGLIDVYTGLKAYTYTHCNINKKQNRELVKTACACGFTVNFSCETTKQCEKALENNCPAVLTVSTMQDDVKIVNGVKYLKCPATTEKTKPVLEKGGLVEKKWQCKNCGICQNCRRGCVVVFPVHGNGSKEEKEKTNLLKW